MKKSWWLLFSILFYALLSGQNNFKIKVFAPEYLQDSLYFGVLETGKNELDYYDIKFKTTPEVHPFLHLPAVRVKIKENGTEVEGQSDFPQPLGIGYYSQKTGSYSSQVFFVEKGNYELHLENLLLNNKVELQSPANIEFAHLKNRVSAFYVKTKSGRDSLTHLEEKQGVLKEYIQKNPESFVALWEMIRDYGFEGYTEKYFDNLRLFSPLVKSSKPYIEFSKTLEIRRKTSVGKPFPDLTFYTEDSISKKDFAKNKYTLLYYWDTQSCKDCMQKIPEVVQLYAHYKDKGLGVTSVSGDYMDKIQLVIKALRIKKATWKNHPDYLKAMKNKVAAYDFPMYFLMDKRGKILFREHSLEKIEIFLGEKLR